MAQLTAKIQLRRDTSTNLANVVLAAGEPGYATDTKKFAIGDGVTTFGKLITPGQEIIVLEDNSTTTAGTWLAKTNEISSLVDGQIFKYKITQAGASTTTLEITGAAGTSLGVKTVYRYNTTKLTTQYPVGSWITFYYSSSLNSGSFVMVDGYDATDDGNYYDRENYVRPYSSTQAIYRYKICAFDKDNRLVPLTTTNQADATIITKTCTTLSFKPDMFYFYNSTTTISASKAVGAQTLYHRYYHTTNIGAYNFNESVPAYRFIYLKGTYNKDTGLFTLYHNSTDTTYKDWYTLVPNNTANLTLSSYFTSGYYYILLCCSFSSAGYVQLLDQHPMYYFDGTNLIHADDIKATTTSDGLMTSEDKVKLNGIESGAEVNIQSDWNQTNTSAKDFIKNKPTIPTVNNGTLTIQKNGTTKGTFTANQSGDTTINITTNADEITSGYFKNQIYINSHPENSPCIVPFLYNDLAFIRRRSGSYHAYTVASNTNLTATTLTPVTDWTTTGLDNAFDGSPSYCTLNSTSLSLSDSVKLVIDIVCPQRFAYNNVFYIDFGSANWRAKNIEVLVSDSDLPSKLYTSKLTKTGNSYGNYYGSVSYSFTNSGGSTVQGFNRLRIVLDHFNSYTTSSPRISQIGIINYGSSGVRNTYMSRGLDDGIYRNLNPSSNKGYSLGTSSLQWNTIYGNTIYENGTALSSKYLGISSKAADADKLDGQDSSYYLNYNNLSNKPTIPSGNSLVSDYDRTYWNSKSEFDGNYNSLSNKPTIPAAQVQTDWNATSGMGVLLNKPNLATVATSGSYNDLSNKPTIPTDYVPTSILQRDGGEIKTKFRCAQKGYTGSGNPVKYYKLCTLPVNDAGNYASAIISGRIGGWTSNDMSSINALVWNRGTPGFALLDIMASETAESGAFNIGDLELFVESNNTASVYARVAGYFTFDLDIELYQSTATIAYTGNQVTPTGTSNCRASTSNKRMIIMNSKAYVNGNQLAFASDIPSLSGYATQSWVTSQGYLTSHQDISGKLDKSGGTMTGDLFYKAMGSNPSSGAINGGFYFHNSNSANTSSYCFGLYQWGDVFQFTSRTKNSTPGGAYRATAFEINGNTGKTDFKQTPSVNGTNIALTTQIPTVTSAITSGSSAAVTSGAVYTGLSNKCSFNTSDSTKAQTFRVLTQAQYDALTPDANTVYLITG